MSKERCCVCGIATDDGEPYEVKGKMVNATMRAHGQAYHLGCWVGAGHTLSDDESAMLRNVTECLFQRRNVIN